MNYLLKLVFISYLTIGILGFNTAQAKWANDTKGCKVWIEGETTGQAPGWSGRCHNGFASGKGKVIYHYRAANEVKSCNGTMQKGKMQGHVNCTLNSGDSFSGTLQKDKIVGRGVYKWHVRKNCPNCPRQYSGIFHNNVFSVGTLALSNGQKVKLQYHPTQKGCLVWNPDPKHGEVITWTGGCQGGYANGRGVLTYRSRTETETTRGVLKNGMIEGHAVVDGTHTTACKDCIVHYDGLFKFHKPVKGVATLGNGRKVQHNVQQSQNNNAALEDATADYVVTHYMHYYLNNIYK